MCFPLMSKRPRQAVVVPDLSGGMNLRDSVSMVLDNQLTEARNVWFKDGVLKTRPGISEMKHLEKESLRDTDIMSHEIFYTVEGKVCRLFTAQSDTHIYFFWIGKDKFIELSSIETDRKNFFVVQKDKMIYCFLRSGTVYKCDISADEQRWEVLGEKDFYVPTLATNCMVNGINFSGDMLESYNLLGSKYKIIYSTINQNYHQYYNAETGEGDKVTLHEMNYSNIFGNDLEEGTKYEGQKIVAKITDKFGEIVTHEITIGPDGTGQESTVNKKDGLLMQGSVGGIIFFCDENCWEIAHATTNQTFVRNNLEIIFPIVHDEKTTQKIFNMSCATWFGGAAEGISGGTRLFLGGNSSEPNLVVWSDLNNPLYFPENNYFYVGESTSPVTAFGKQSDMLVIFKDNETYYTQYQRNTGITAEAVMNQSVIDIAASSVYFPLTLINANIGCDCPNTVELCRNRLVWTNSDGRVYTLVSSNQYNERNIFEIGEMVYRKLKTEKNLKNARSADWDGYYLLHTKDTEGNRIYILDYNSYGYQYVSSYSKTEDANLRIPWYYWDFDLKTGYSQSTALDIVDGSLLLVESGYYGIFKAEFNEEAAYDNLAYLYEPLLEEYRTNSFPIKSEAQTKLFEFGAQGYYKNVDKVVLSVGNNGGVPINVSFVTDMGTEETEIVPDGAETVAYTPGYVKSMQLSPCVRQVERFGVKLSCDGPLAVDGITLTYRVTGGAR